MEQLRQLGFAMGAEQGARSVTALQMACSADTLLRLIRRTPLPPHATPTHLGVDDWAFRRTVSHGTMLVDLQDHQVVDLLPDRSASSLESWLKAHPGVQLISRDRSGEYALKDVAMVPNSTGRVWSWALQASASKSHA